MEWYRTIQAQDEPSPKENEGQDPPDDYRGQHQAPMSDGGAPLHDLSGIYPDDVHGPMGARYYGHSGGDRLDRKAIAIMNSMRHRPNKQVKVYRAVPSERTIAEQIALLEAQMRQFMRRNKVPDQSKLSGSAWYNDAYNRLAVLKARPEQDKPAEITAINPGDWVTTVREYAVSHGESSLLGNYKIISKTVHARDLFTDGNSIFEFGYDPQPPVESPRTEP